MSDKDLIEKTINSQHIFSGKFLQILNDDVLLPDNKPAKREYVKHPGGVAIFAIDDENNIILERQYRHPTHEVIVEIPAGKLDPNEDTLECGKRELLEETGYAAKYWHKLGSIFPSVGYSSENLVFYIAKDLEFTKQHLDDGEFLEVYKQPINDFINDAYSGKIKDGKTMAGLVLLLGYLARQ